MSWEYHYQPLQDLFIFHAKGEVYDDDLISGNQAVVSHPSFRPDSRVFLDFSAVDEFKLSPCWPERLNALEAVQNIRGKHAFLIFGPLGSSNFQRNLKTLCCSRWFQTFTARKDAYDWLNERLPAGMHISGGPWHTLTSFSARYVQQVNQQITLAGTSPEESNLSKCLGT